MTNEEKQEMARQLEDSIADLTSYLAIEPEPADSDDIRWRIKVEILAHDALTAPPVKLPKGFSPAIGDIFDMTAPVMRRDSSDGKWLHKADVARILNDLGYEVQE